MNIVLKCKIDLDELIRVAAINPTILNDPPRVEFDGGSVQFDTPNEVIEWIRYAVAEAKK